MRVRLYKIVYFNMLKDKKETIFLLGHDFWCAIQEANKYLDKAICSDCWDLISVRPLKTKIVNAVLNEDENQEGQVPDSNFAKMKCPHCGAENNFPAGMSEVKCANCKQSFTTNDEG